MSGRKSFTLMETILAMSIIIMIMGTLYAFYHHALKMTVHGREKLEDVQIARVVLHKIAAELRGVTSSGARFTTVLKGEADKISFITTVVPSRLVFFPQDFMDKGRVIEHDLRNVEYYISRSKDQDNKALGLERDELRCMLTPLIEKKDPGELTEEDVRKAKEEQEKFKVDLDMGTNKAVSEQPLINQELITDRIKYLRFDYFDGKQWQTKWKRSGSDAIPRAVQVTIGFVEATDDEFKDESQIAFDQRPWHDDRYTLIVSLILSDDLKAQYGGKGAKE